MSWSQNFLRHLPLTPHTPSFNTIHSCDCHTPHNAHFPQWPPLPQWPPHRSRPPPPSPKDLILSIVTSMPPPPPLNSSMTSHWDYHVPATLPTSHSHNIHSPPHTQEVHTLQSSPIPTSITTTFTPYQVHIHTEWQLLCNEQLDFQPDANKLRNIHN